MSSSLDIDTRIRVRRPAPTFNAQAVVQENIMDISSESYVNSKHWLLLMFFPRAFSVVCPTEIRAFSARLDEFHYKRKCGVAFVSTDSIECLRAWNMMPAIKGGLGNVRVPLISDVDRSLSRHFEVLVDSEGSAERATFIIDPKGHLRSMAVNDTDIGRSVDEVLRLLDALKHRDEFGEACPVDWKSGGAGINVGAEKAIAFKVSDYAKNGTGRHTPDRAPDELPNGKKEIKAPQPKRSKLSKVLMMKGRMNGKVQADDGDRRHSN